MPNPTALPETVPVATRQTQPWPVMAWPVMAWPVMARAALHELYGGAEADAPSLTGAALALISLAGNGPVLWVRHTFLDSEAGGLYGPGLAAFGADPARLILMRARDAATALQAGLDGARCGALCAVVIELRGETRALDLTASRRLALAARASGGLVLLVRSGAQPQPSAAQTRWQIRASPSHPLAANAPGHPAFSLTLLRHRGGQTEGGNAGVSTGADTGTGDRLEWHRDG